VSKFFEFSFSFEAADEEHAERIMESMIEVYCGPHDEKNACRNPNWCASGPIVIPDDEPADNESTGDGGSVG